MKLYRITYRQSREGETETTTFKGYDSEHAQDRFMDAMKEEGGIEGLTVLSIVRVTVRNGIEFIA